MMAARVAPYPMASALLQPVCRKLAARKAAIRLMLR
jgi:hypothetical protein